MQSRAGRPGGHSGLAGLPAPLLRAPEDASVINGATGLGYAVLPEPPQDPSPTHAIDAILAAARKHAGELVLVATGPLTNISAALLRDPGCRAG